MRRYTSKRGTYFTLIGGGAEGDETAEQAAIREAKEETDLDVLLGESFTIRNEFDGREHTYFIVRGWTGTPRIVGEEAESGPDNEHELVWMPIEHLRSFNVKPEEAVERFLELIGSEEQMIR
jgi:8-oxo-dGTP diphosphatase